MKSENITHPIKPVYDNNSKILILGSFPSVKSREEGFFYGHKQNRFWTILSNIFDVDKPISIDDKKLLLINKNIAVWDVIKSCDIVGSSDSSIKNVVPNDINYIINNSNISTVFVNGKTAEKLYIKHVQPITNIKAICLPSTSPANAAWKTDKLAEHWKAEIIKALDD